MCCRQEWQNPKLEVLSLQEMEDNNICSLLTFVVVSRKDTPSFQAVIIDLQGIEHAAALQLAKVVCKAVDRKTMPVVALSFTLSTAAQQELREAGFSLTVQKPLRQTTLAVGLLQAVGAQLQTIAKKVNNKMLAGKHIIVVCLCLFCFCMLVLNFSNLCLDQCTGHCTLFV
jgi:hypothetical protein